MSRKKCTFCCYTRLPQILMYDIYGRLTINNMYRQKAVHCISNAIILKAFLPTEQASQWEQVKLFLNLGTPVFITDASEEHKKCIYKPRKQNIYEKCLDSYVLFENWNTYLSCPCTNKRLAKSLHACANVIWTDYYILCISPHHNVPLIYTNPQSFIQPSTNQATGLLFM